MTLNSFKEVKKSVGTTIVSICEAISDTSPVGEKEGTMFSPSLSTMVHHHLMGQRMATVQIIL